MRALFVSFFYPPFNSIGGLRVSKMTRYLLERGWDVRVLTADRDDLSADLPIEISTERITRAPWFDVNLPVKLLLGRARVRAAGYEPGPGAGPLRRLGALYRDIVNFPDGQIGWYRGAVRAGQRLVRSWRPDVVVSSALPGTAHLVAAALASAVGAPWIAEYRDPWTDAPGRRRRWPLSTLERSLERRTLATAAGIVTVSEAWAAALRLRWPNTPVTVIPNGFDPRDYPGDSAPAAPPLRLLYSGRLYERQSLQPLFEALRLVASTPDACPVRFDLMGRYLAAAAEGARRAGCDESVVRILPPVAHREALAAQQRAHVLVIVLARDGDIGWRPAKLYEYLGARRPILMLGGTPGHEARMILLRTGAGVAADDAGAIADQLRSWCSDLRETGAVRCEPDREEVARYDRRRLAADMADFIERVVAAQSRSGGGQTPR